MIRFLLKCIATVSLILALSILVTFISITSKSGKISEQVPKTEQVIYTLSEYKGKIALYKAGYAMPVEIYDVYVESLPDEEQERVKEGITARSDEEIIKIIEAYTS